MMQGRRMAVPWLLTILLACFAVQQLFASEPLFYESFDETFEGRWIASEKDDYKAWVILVLLCKLDSKAKQYQEVALSYLFLANNLLYVVRKVPGCNLLELFGDDWGSRQDSKATGYASSYEWLAWSKVLATIPQELADMDAEATREHMRHFNEAFEGVYRG